jgi:hypothetical protein
LEQGTGDLFHAGVRVGRGGRRSWLCLAEYLVVELDLGRGWASGSAFLASERRLRNPRFPGNP